jgi:hypothetical protein
MEMKMDLMELKMGLMTYYVITISCDEPVCYVSVSLIFNTGLILISQIRVVGLQSRPGKTGEAGPSLDTLPPRINKR